MVTESKTYNGWANYETWAVKLWIDNEEGSYRYWKEQASDCWKGAAPTEFWTREEAAKFALAERLLSDFEDGMANVLKAAKATASVWADLLGAALGEVNWDEIAGSMIEERTE